jgi:hypothetical protein
LFFFFEVAFLVTYLVIDAIALRAPDDMVENLAESPWMSSNGPRSTPIEIPKEGFLLSPRARKREEMKSFAGWRRKKVVC